MILPHPLRAPLALSVVLAFACTGPTQGPARNEGGGLAGGGDGAPEDETDDEAVAERGSVGDCSPTNRGIEVCDGVDNDCDGEPDEAADLMAVGAVGGACSDGDGECAAGVEVCEGGELVCRGGVAPAPEVCDGLDNDCDGETDEAEDLRVSGETGDRCGESEGQCRRGIVRCRDASLLCDGVIDPQAEVCNDRDDDCDGATDEIAGLDEAGITGAPCGSAVGACQAGRTRCVAGALVCEGEVQAVEEACDGLDNDCDGAVDEFDDLALSGVAGGRCGSNDGQCTFGISLCVDAALVCDGAVAPTDEICDGFDNDCDGAVDEAFEELGQACGTGACRGGEMVCDERDPDGLSLVCSTAGQAEDEVCDGRDNDCDSEADERPDLERLGVVAVPCGTDEGECSQGIADCLRGGDLVCVDEVPPVEEACDLLDNDCDGELDEDVLQCRDGEYFCDMAEATPEVCDGIDNDCDEVWDEADPEMGAACERLDGGCRRPGRMACVQGVMSCGPAGAQEPCIAVEREEEPNNTGNTCNPVVTGGHSVRGVVAQDGDRDWYCFQARANQQVTFDIDARVDGSSLDSYLYLWKLTPRVELARNDDSGGSLDSLIDWRFDSDGRYAIEVGSWRDRGCADCDYRLTIR